MLAEIVAAAAASAEARQSARVLVDEQAALLRVAALVAQGPAKPRSSPSSPWRRQGLVDDEPTTLVRYEGGRTLTVLATHHGPAPIGTRSHGSRRAPAPSDQMLRAQAGAVGPTTTPSPRRPCPTGSSAWVERVDPHRRRRATVGEPGAPWTRGGDAGGDGGAPGQVRRLVASALAGAREPMPRARAGSAGQAALRRVAELVAGAARHGAVLQAVVAKACALFDDVAVTVWQARACGHLDVARGRRGARDPRHGSPVHRGPIAPAGAGQRTARHGSTACRSCRVPDAHPYEGRTWAVLRRRRPASAAPACNGGPTRAVRADRRHRRDQ